MKAPYKPNNRATVLSSNTTPMHTFRENHNSNGYMHSNILCSSVNKSQDMEAT